MEVGERIQCEYVGKYQADDKYGNHYLVVRNDDDYYRVRAYSYQWDFDAIPSVIECEVISKEPLKLVQSWEFLLRDRYPTKRNATFQIYGENVDSTTKVKYYILKDPYGLTHRFYPGRDDHYKLGDAIELVVNGISNLDNKKPHLRLTPFCKTQSSSASSSIDSNDGIVADAPITICKV